MGFDFGTVYVRSRSLGDVREALVELMAENDRIEIRERGVEPTPEDTPALKAVRSFALMPVDDDWVTVLEDGHSLDDGGVAEGLSDLLQAESLHFAYSDADGFWSYEMYWEGQPLESGGAEDTDYDVSATAFAESRSLPHFGVYYEEVAAAAGEAQPVVAGALGFFGAIVPRVPMGTEVVTFKRPGGKPPE
jgi:hypothetical protein